MTNITTIHQSEGTNWRANSAAQLVLKWLPQLALFGRGLVVDDDTHQVEQTIQTGGIEITPWHRRALAGNEASTWPRGGPFDFAMVRLAKSRSAQDMACHAALSVLHPNGRLFVYGANDEGIKTIEARLITLSGSARTVAVGKHCRIVTCVRSSGISDLKSELQQWIEISEVVVAGKHLRWVTYPGVFSLGRIDEGTQLLIENLPKIQPGARVLDFGCGSGAISAAMLTSQPESIVSALDVDALAIEATKENVPSAKTILGSGLAAAGTGKFDLILSNPPFHEGTADDLSIMKRFFRDASSFLRPGGQLQIVAQGRIQADRILRESFSEVVEVAHNNRYRVWQTRRV